MKSKTKLFTAAVIACALVLVFTACAGCTSNSSSSSTSTTEDPIVGTYVKEWSDGSKIVWEFTSDGTGNGYSVGTDGYVEKTSFKWTKTGENRYESGLVIFKLSDDKYSLSVTTADGDTTTYNKYSTYTIPTVSPTKKATTSPTKTATVSPTSVPTSSATIGEENALKKAKSYLRSNGFSESRLEKQLEYEGFTASQIQYAIKNCGADWNEEAVEKAKSYLRSNGFSASGLKKQLEYEGFTASQIQYAMSEVGY